MAPPSDVTGRVQGVLRSSLRALRRVRDLAGNGGAPARVDRTGGAARAGVGDSDQVDPTDRGGAQVGHAQRDGAQGGYAPVEDGKADPGEVVWAWVPFEENARKGKDRPVLVVGLEGESLLALQLTSFDHDRDAAQEAEAGRFWMDVGTGAWDHRRRPSEVRLNRLLRLDPSAVRRTGAAMDRELFEEVLAAARGYLPEL